MNRVVLSLSRFPKLSESFIVDKFLGLLKNGWDVYIVCHKSETDDWDNFRNLSEYYEMRKRTCSIWPIGNKWQLLLKVPFSLAKCFLYHPIGTFIYLQRGYAMFGASIFRKLLQDTYYISLKPEVIHFEFGAIARDKMYLKKLLPKVKITVSFRGYDLNYVGLEDDNYYLPIWKNADHVHFLGKDLQKRAISRKYPKSRPCAFISPAINPKVFEPNGSKLYEKVGSKSRPLRILSVGRFHWKKGYEFALQAMQKLQQKGIEFEYRIVGAGPSLEEISFLRHIMNFENKIQFLGTKRREEISQELKWADVFLHTAVSEGFCNSVIEAQAMRVPVICSDADGLSENVMTGITGYVVARRNPEEISARLKELADDPMKRQTMGDQGRKHVLEKFQQDKQNQAWNAFFQQVLKKSDQNVGNQN